MLGGEYNGFDCNFVFLIPRYLSKYFILKHPYLCSSLKVRDQVSQPYNTTGNIIILYVLTFNFLESKQDNKIFSSE